MNQKPLPDDDPAVELQDKIETVLEGCSHRDGINALCNLLSQVIADDADSCEQAKLMAVSAGDSIAQQIKRNWPLIEARRKAKAN